MYISDPAVYSFIKQNAKPSKSKKPKPKSSGHKNKRTASMARIDDALNKLAGYASYTWTLY